ncbi:MAG TPA: di-heme-cytochrome C peroxidase [Roseiarcus sp.]|nr:di-heme-cytochrome C peroxidase [Roseiarcus sp.]
MRWKSGQDSKEPWVGFTCAACHTAEIAYKGQSLRIEGGPARADFQGFIEALERAVIETSRQAAKFQRFAAKVLQSENTPGNQARLRAALNQWIKFEMGLERLDCAELHGVACRDIRYGYGRLDAFGHIFNKVADIVSAHPTANPANAPVRYPVLWNVPQENFTQWNASVPKQSTLTLVEPFDFGALARNTGEVVGVFGDIEPVTHPDLSGFNSSVQIATLVAYELMLGQLEPPSWPDAFGTPDPAAVAEGQKLYRDHCVACHAVFSQNDLSTPIDVKPQPVPSDEWTDPLMACNAALDTAASGLLQGTKQFILSGKPLKRVAASVEMLFATVTAVLLNKKVEIAEDAIGSWIGAVPQPIVIPPKHLLVGAVRNERLANLRELACRSKGVQIVYKARPLDGVWAAAPYLHNGSVPTLYDLLRAPKDRPKSFWIGTREYNPENAGYVTTRSADNNFLFQTSIPGNSNQGHDFGASKFTEEQRRALLAYLKTL